MVYVIEKLRKSMQNARKGDKKRMKVVALAGGVGGAKLADGRYQLDDELALSVVVNTGDDFDLFGLRICPDLDTVCYTLAGIENPETGWGRAEEGWDTYNEISRLGGPDWFKLGNKDLALHLERTRRLDEGEPLSRITASICRHLGISAQILPMSDTPVATIVKTNQGDLEFQDYFVRLGCKPVVRGFVFQGADAARPADAVIQSICDADLVVICPSNPWVSIDPILAIPGIKRELKDKVILAVSPIIGGKAVKGPAAKMFREMGIDPTPAAVAKHYQGLITGLVLDLADQEIITQLAGSDLKNIKVIAAETWMKNRGDRRKLAQDVVSFGWELIKEGA